MLTNSPHTFGRGPALETRDLVLRYGAFTAVDRLSFAVAEGEVFGLLGPNGAGKSSTIKVLTTLLPPSSGAAFVAGFDVVREPVPVRRSIGYVPQLLSSDGTLTGYENLMVFAKLYDLRRGERDRTVRHALDYMGLSAAGNRLVRTYSGGMIRRLEIAQSLLHHPRVLFLDEPTVGLDPVARRAVWAHVEQLRQDYGMTILLTTHLMEEAEALCTRIGIMHNGRLVTVGAPAELKASLPRPDSTLDDVFIHYTGDHLQNGEGSYRDIARARKTAQRLG
jgi:ABC-2 type transport system ATP-binding protein